MKKADNIFRTKSGEIKCSKGTVQITFQNSIPSFENSLDPDQLASDKARQLIRIPTVYPHSGSILIK